jgi:DEAD/DEAH box helicase domain-containing protein
MRACLVQKPQPVALTAEAHLTPEHMERVILPGSVGLNISRENEEFLIDDIILHRDLNRLMYKGKHLSQQQARSHRGVVVTVPVQQIQAIPGESQIGFYNYTTGQVEPLPV